MENENIRKAAEAMAIEIISINTHFLSFSEESLAEEYFTNGFIAGAAFAQEQTEQSEAGVLQPWISVNDKMPIQGQKVLVSAMVEGTEIVCVETHMFYNGQWFPKNTVSRAERHPITRWMPLPELPTK